MYTTVMFVRGDTPVSLHVRLYDSITIYYIKY